MKNIELKDVCCIVEASKGSQFLLWEKYHDEVNWISQNSGDMVTVGQCNNLPVVISIFYATICGKRVAFWEATSRMVDYEMVREWFEINFQPRTSDNHFDDSSFGTFIGRNKNYVSNEESAKTFWETI